MTVKSDDVTGRVKTYEAIIKGENIQDPGIPESFKVLLKELQSLALDVTVLDENGDEVQMTEAIDYGDEEISRFMEGDETLNRDQESLNGQNGYRQVSSKEEEEAFDTEDGSFNEVFGDEEGIGLVELEDYTE